MTHQNQSSFTYRIIERSKRYTVVISYKDRSGQHKQKWISTEIEIPAYCLAEKNGGKLKVSKEAKMKAQELVDKWKQEFFPVEKEKTQITAEEYFIAWQEKREEPKILKTKANKTLSPTTLANDRNIIKKIASFFGTKKITELTSDDVLDYLTLHAQGIGYKKPCTNTTHKHWLKIKQVLNAAVKEGIIYKNPAVGDEIEPAREKPKEGQIFHSDELKKILKSLENDPIEIAVYLLFFGVLRREEACGLDWDHIDLVHREFHVRQVYQQFSDPRKGKTLILTDKPKTDATVREQPISEMLYAVLSKVPEEERIGPVCKGLNGKRLEPEYLSDHFSDIQKKNNISHRRLYDLRHTAVTYLLSKDCAFPLVQVLAGHKRQETTSRFYTHYGMEKKREGIAILDSFFQD